MKIIFWIALFVLLLHVYPQFVLWVAVAMVGVPAMMGAALLIWKSIK